MVLFGSRGGWVHSLRASDGQLAWKFTGMPERRLVCDAGRLESAWPVNGSIMIFEDTQRCENNCSKTANGLKLGARPQCLEIVDHPLKA